MKHIHTHTPSHRYTPNYSQPMCVCVLCGCVCAWRVKDDGAAGVSAQTGGSSIKRHESDHSKTQKRGMRRIGTKTGRIADRGRIGGGVWKSRIKSRYPQIVAFCLNRHTETKTKSRTHALTIEPATQEVLGNQSEAKGCDQFIHTSLANPHPTLTDTHISNTSAYGLVVHVLPLPSLWFPYPVLCCEER